MECQISENGFLNIKKVAQNLHVAFQYERVIRDLEDELKRCSSGEVVLTFEERESLKKELNDAVCMYKIYS
jgi:hypothetical protein